MQTGDRARIAETARQLIAQTEGILAQLRLAEGKPQEAIALYQQSLEGSADNRRRLEFASALLRTGHAAEAVTATDPVVQQEPANAAAWLTRGSALRDAGREKEAVDAFTHALQLRPDTNVAFALGSTLLALHRPQEAAKLFEQILTSTGHSAIWYIAVGDAYRDAGYMDDAVAHLKQGLARDPQVAHGEFFLGLTYLQMNQWGPNSDSFVHLRRAAQQAQHEYVSNFYLGALESTDGSDLVSSDRHLHLATEADPKQAEAWLYLGLNANREHDTAHAREYLRKAIDLTGADEARNNYQVRRAYFALGRLLIAAGERAEGEQLLARYRVAEQAAVAQSAGSIAAQQASGGPTQQAGQHEGADLLASSAAAVDARLKPAAGASAAEPEADPATRKAQQAAEARLRTLLANAYNDLGTAEARAGDYGTALHDFQQGEQWDAALPGLERNLGVAAFRLGDSQEAVRALSSYRATGGAQAVADGRAQLMLALSEFSQGQFPAAAKSFAAVEEQAMADPRAAYSYAFSLARTGHAQEANRIADRLMAGNTVTPEVLPLVCHLYIGTENYEGSQSCFRKAIAQNPSLPLAHYEIGESLIRLDRPAEAIPELQQELTLSPGDPNVQAALAFALLQTSHKDEARALLVELTAAHPEHAEAQYQYGKLLLEEGHTEEAITHLERAAQADAGKYYIHYQLGTAYKKAGRSSDAEREFAAYRSIKESSRNANAIPN